MARTTVFIAVSRGLICRNILRCGVLDELLRNPDVHIVLLLPRHRDGIPPYLREEFSHPQISLEEVPDRKDSFWLVRLWLPFINNFVYTDFTDMLAREGSGKVKPVPRWWYPIHRALFMKLSKFAWLKRVTRRLDAMLFRAKGFDELFRRYRPDVVFCGSIVSKYDIAVLKAAAQHGIPTVGMQKGWDNLQKQLLRHVPDLFLLQNRVMNGAAEHIQSIPASRLRLVGFPQFDLFTEPDRLPNREVFCAQLGIDPADHIIFFGSEGLWTPNDDRILDELLAFRKAGAFPFPVTIIIRPHFSDVAKNRLEKYRDLPGVIVDRYRWGAYFMDAWDPSVEDNRYFASELRHASALICIASTLSLDAACFDLPIVNVAYGAYIRPDGTDLTENLYRADHYQPVIASGGVELVRGGEDLKTAIIRAVEERAYRAEGRANLRETMCGPLDGKSASRIAQAILETANSYATR